MTRQPMRLRRWERIRKIWIWLKFIFEVKILFYFFCSKMLQNMIFLKYLENVFFCCKFPFFCQKYIKLFFKFSFIYCFQYIFRKNIPKIDQIISKIFWQIPSEIKMLYFFCSNFFVNFPFLSKNIGNNLINF